MAQSKKQNYLHGAAILAMGVVITKILGAVYKIPLGNILGEKGYAYFLSAYNIYAVLLTLSTSGLPVVLSKMIVEANVLNRPKQVKKTFQIALITFLSVGALCACVMFLFPSELASELGGNIQASQGVLVLAPAVLLVCILSAYRGYIQGFSNMTPTSVSQVIEVAVKVIVGLILAVIFTNAGRGLPEVSAAAIAGVPIATLFACVYVIYQKRKLDRANAAVYSGNDACDSTKQIFTRLLKLGIPITLGSSISSIITLLDTNITQSRLQMGAGFSMDEASVLFGIYGLAITLFNLPAALVTPLSISVVPSISESVAHKNYKEASTTTGSVLRISTLLALPMGVGLCVLGTPIMRAVYEGNYEIGGTLLGFMGIASYFVCISLVSTAALQAYGAVRLPIYSMLTGGIVKVLLNWILVSNPEIHIYGAPIATLSCYIVMSIMNYIFLQMHIKEKMSLSQIILRPAFSAAVMGVAAYAIYGLGEKLLGMDLSRLMTMVCLVAAIGVAVIIYLVLVIATRAITAEDLLLLPKGEKLAKLLRLR